MEKISPTSPCCIIVKLKVLGSSVSLANWLDLLVLSNLHSATELKKRVMEYIRQNRRSIVKQESWDTALREMPDLFKEIVEAVMI
jgi:hypothetical protein